MVTMDYHAIRCVIAGLLLDLNNGIGFLNSPQGPGFQIAVKKGSWNCIPAGSGSHHQADSHLIFRVCDDQ